jgi:hypothetical protein
VRRDLDRERLLEFLAALGRVAREPATVYLTGGATAVLHGWRNATVDVDLKLEPESDTLLRALPRLKEELQLNVELASPDGFVPELAGWRERSPFVAQQGRLTVRHYDLYSQALAKIERGHARDLLDVREMLARGLVDAARLRVLFAEMEPSFYKYPAVDPPTFRRALEFVLEEPPIDCSEDG